MINWTGYELIVGSSPDPQFGPVLLFGMGGQLVEVFKDRALALPPLNTTLARQLIDETTISHALKGVRGRKPIDKDVARRAPRALQRARRGAAAHRRDRHQPAARVAGADHRARRARRPAPGRRSRTRTCRASRSARTRTSTSARRRTDDGVPHRCPADPARGRADASPASTPACPTADRRRPLRHRPPARPSAPRTSASPGSASPTTTASSRWWPRSQGRRGGARVRRHRPRVAHPRVATTATLTMTVADAWQRRGVGACLVRAAIDGRAGRGRRATWSRSSAPATRGMRELLEAEGFAFEEGDGVLVATLPIT